MLKYEFLKIIHNKYLISILAILLILNCVLIYSTTKERISIPSDVMSKIIKEYIQDPVSIETYYNEILQFQREQTEIEHEHRLHGYLDYTPLVVDNKYSTSDTISDLVLLNELFIRVNYIKSYQSDLANIISSAQKSIEDYKVSGVFPNSYAFKYQLNLINAYSDLSTNVTLGLEYTRGWGDFFSWQSVDVFISLSIIVLASICFVNEYKSGVLNIIKCVKYGRSKTVWCKLLCFIISCYIIIFLFLFSTWLMFAFKFGYSSIFNSIQIIDDLKLCPYKLSILEYLIIFFAFKSISFLVFGSTILLISIVTYNNIITYACGLGIFGLNYLLHTFRYDNPNNFLKYANLISSASVSRIFSKYNSINLFQCVRDMSLFLFCALFITLIFLLIVTAYLYCEKHIISSNISKIPKVNFTHVYRSTNIKKKEKTYNTSLFAFEFYKLYITTKYFLVILILLIAKIYLSVNTYDYSQTYSDTVYHEYMTELAGELTVEKREYIQDERMTIDHILSLEKEMKNQYANDQISFAEYSNFLKQYNYAYNREAIFTTIESHAAYIEKLSSEGYSAWFVYDTGWMALFSNGFDWSLYILILILFSGVFCVESEGTSSSGHFSNILRSTKNGRSITYFNKLYTVITSSFIISLIWISIDLTRFFMTYDMPLKNAPLKSIQQMYSFTYEISIFQFMLLYIFLRIIAALFLALFTFTISCLLRKNISVLSTVSIVTLLPFLISKIGGTFFKNINFVSYLMATPVLLQSTLFIFYTVCLLIICYLLILLSKKRWCL